MTLNARVDLNIGATLINSLDLASEGKVPLSMAKALVLSTGTGAGQADQMWFDTRTILASANDDLDLVGGLTNGLGQAANFAKIKLLYVYSDPDNLNDIWIGGVGTANSRPSWQSEDANEIIVPPGGLFLLTAPDADAYPVTPGTNDVLRITNAAGGSSVSYDIVLLGTTA